MVCFLFFIPSVLSKQNDDGKIKFPPSTSIENQTETKVLQRDIVQYISATGLTIYTELYDIRSSLSGKLAINNMKLGKRVKKNEILCKLETTKLLKDKEKIESNLKIAQKKLQTYKKAGESIEKTALEIQLWELDNELSLKRDELFSLQKQFEREMIPEIEIKRKKKEIVLIDKKYNLVQTKLRQLDEMLLENIIEQESMIQLDTYKIQEIEDQLSKAIILSPIYGKIITVSESLPNIHLKVNETYVAQGEKLCRIADDRKKGIYILLKAKDFSKVSKKNEVIIKPNKKVAIKGRITELLPAIQNQKYGESEFPVIIKILNSDMAFIVGTYVDCQIEVEKKNMVLSVPIDFIYLDGNSAFCYVYSNQQVLKQNIDLGIDDGNYVEIINGLNLNDRIVKKSTFLNDKTQ